MTSSMAVTVQGRGTTTSLQTLETVRAPVQSEGTTQKLWVLISGQCSGDVWRQVSATRLLAFCHSLFVSQPYVIAHSGLAL